MLKNILNLEGVTVLNKKQQSTINGGASFTCYCGFVGGGNEQHAQVINGQVSYQNGHLLQ